MAQDIDFFERRFSELFDLVEDLREKIFIQDGVWFKRHRYSRDQLFHDPLLYKINARYGAIEFNVRAWKEADSVETELLAYCEENLARVEQSIMSVLEEIESRKPTGWERIRDLILGVFKFAARKLVADHLPLIGPRR